MKKIIFTGGGTTGHVTKNKILIEALKQSHPDLERHYLGLKKGKEAELITADLAIFHPISSGKLRRYFAWETIPDFFRFLTGIAQSWFKLGKLQPNLVFSSGGFVALPVATAAWLRGIPIITHETDSTPGLANRLIGRMAKKILLGYDSARDHFNPAKTIATGNPVSPELFNGSKERALKKLGFSADKKTILVMGGSQGAKQINELIERILPELTQKWQIIHLTGKGKDLSLRACRSNLTSPDTDCFVPRNDNAMPRNEGCYRPFNYITTEYPDFLTLADLVISRAGGNSLAEIAALGKPAILIPLPLPAAAGDHQLKNAKEMQQKNPDWIVLSGQDANAEMLLISVQELILSEPQMAENPAGNMAIDGILKVLRDYF